jgi:hypothetical protein
MFKRSNVTKIQKEQEKLRKKKEDRVNKKVNDIVFPAIKEISDDIDDALIIINVLNQVIQQAMINSRDKTTVNDLNLLDLMNDNTDKVNKYKNVINLISDESVKDAISILQGIAEEINLKQRLFWKGKKLTELYGN